MKTPKQGSDLKVYIILTQGNTFVNKLQKKGVSTSRGAKVGEGK